MLRGGLDRQANWLYGVIVGLAIRESLVQGVEHISGHALSRQSWVAMLEGWRLALFLLLIIRFYFGSVIFFDESHSSESSKRSFGLDFLIGLLHFILFFGLSTTISVHSRGAHGFSSFEKMLVVVLLYDLLWVGLCFHYDDAKRINLWAVINVITVCLCASVFGVSRAFDADPVLTEHLAMIPVILFSVVDLWDMISEKKSFTRFMQWVLRIIPN